MDCLVLGVPFCLLLLAAAPAWASQDTQHDAATVEIAFYQLSSEKFEMHDIAFREALLEGLNTYCVEHHPECGLTEWMSVYNFTHSDIQIVSHHQDPDVKSRFLVKYYVRYNENVPSNRKNNGEDTVLNKQATLAASEEARRALGEKVGRPIVRIGDKMFSPEPNHQLNIIIIAVALVVFLVLLLIVVGCVIKSKKDEKKALSVNNKQDMELTKMTPEET